MVPKSEHHPRRMIYNELAAFWVDGLTPPIARHFRPNRRPEQNSLLRDTSRKRKSRSLISTDRGKFISFF